MSKFNAATGRTSTGPISVERTPSTVTAQGGAGFVRDAKSELFMLSVSNMVGENTFYEGSSERDQRFRDLVHAATIIDVEWTKQFIAWLRTGANMRSASLVAAAEAARAMLAAKVTGSRAIVASALQRPDEPGEMLAYWTSQYGRNIPKPVKRGVADAVQRLYNERALLKYDGASKGFRFGDVLDLTHPAPTGPWQGDLFKYALDRRHNRDELVIPETLSAVRARLELGALPVDERHAFMRRVQAGDSAATEKFNLAMASQWEWAKSWLGG